MLPASVILLHLAGGYGTLPVPLRTAVPDRWCLRCCCVLPQVWPGATHFPDFLSNATAEWWGRWLEDMHRRVPFSGLWLDMNEVSNFCTGEVCEYSAVPWFAGCQLSCR